MKRILFICCFVFFLTVPGRIFAEDLCTSSDPCTSASDKVACYQNVVNSCQNTRDTLASQITYFNNQIQLTTFQIQSIKSLIGKLTSEINQLVDEVQVLETKLTKQAELVQKRVPESYKEYIASSDMVSLLFSKNIGDLVERIQYIKKVQEQDLKLFVQYKATQNNYEERKVQREEKKQKQQQAQLELERKNVELDQQKQAKNLLLQQTNGQEAIYQELLAQAKAQLAGFSSFASSQGGATILSGQTVCDDWGCYYNQRDSQWGTVALNRTQYTLASDGCLVTSMAMVYTHFGHKNVTPLTINANSSNFASYYPAYLNRTIVADGMTTTRVASTIDSELNAGRPVVVGIRYGNGDTHFVVLISGSGGTYVMNDPFIPNGHKISFNSYYSISSIYEIDRISIN